MSQMLVNQSWSHHVGYNKLFVLLTCFHQWYFVSYSCVSQKICSCLVQSSKYCSLNGYLCLQGVISTINETQGILVFINKCLILQDYRMRLHGSEKLYLRAYAILKNEKCVCYHSICYHQIPLSSTARLPWIFFSVSLVLCCSVWNLLFWFSLLPFMLIKCYKCMKYFPSD